MDTLTLTSTAGPGSLAEAYGQADFALVASILVSMLVMAIRVLGLGNLLGKQWWRWVALGLGVAAGVVLGVMAGRPWMATIMPALMIGVLAVGQWEIVLGPVLGRMGLKAKLPSPAMPSPPPGPPT